MLKVFRKYCLTQKIAIIFIILFLTAGYTSAGYTFYYYFSGNEKTSCCKSDENCPCCKAEKSDKSNCTCSVKSIPEFPVKDVEQDLYLNKILNIGNYLLNSYNSTETSIIYSPQKTDYFVEIKTFPPGDIYLEIANLRI